MENAYDNIAIIDLHEERTELSESHEDFLLLYIYNHIFRFDPMDKCCAAKLLDNSIFHFFGIIFGLSVSFQPQSLVRMTILKVAVQPGMCYKG